MQSFGEIRQMYERILEQLTRINARYADLQAQEEQQQKAAQQRKNAAMDRLTEFQNQWRYLFDFARRNQKKYGTQGTEYTFSAYTPQAMQEELQELMNEAASSRDPANRYIREQIVAGALIKTLTYISGQEARVRQELRLTDGGPVSMLPEGGGTGQLRALSAQITDLFRRCWEWRDACEDVTLEAMPLFGFQARPFPILKGDREALPRVRNSAWPFDEGEDGAGVVYLPEGIPNVAYFACHSRKNAGRAAAHLLHYAVNQLQIHMRLKELAHWRTVILDTTTLYDTSIGVLSSLKGDCTSAYASPACHSLQEANETLDELWSLAHTEPAERLLVIRCSLEEIEENRLRRLVNNAEELKLTVILLNETVESQVPFYMKTANAAIYTDQGDYFILEGADRFDFRCPQTEFTARRAEQLRDRLRHREVYDYPVPDPGQVTYHPGNRDLRLPYGVMDDGTVCSYNTQDNETKKGGGGNAGFLVGVSGSGKSTLIHDLIAGLILNYHPDDVELWLADFKMKEFAHYAEHWPPHVRYILLDESQDMICSLVDKLTEEMKRRQRIIAAAGASWYQDPKISPRLPLLFVIIDEFSRMSQAIRDSGEQEYVIKLQNLLTQSRDQGIRILMSSQFYTSGVEALNEQSKGQIGIRLAMCTTDKNEMKETLAIPRGMMTDDQNAMISTLPRYKVLSYEDNTLRKINVYNLSGDNKQRLDEVIDELNRRMIPVDDPSMIPDPLRYTRKEHLFISGDPVKLETFEACRGAFQKELDAHRAARDKGMYFWLGRARRLEATSSMRLLRADYENLLICADFRMEEQLDGMISVVRSLILSAEMQGMSTQIWMHEPSEEMLRQWDGAQLLTQDEQIEEASKHLDLLLDEGRISEKGDRLLILVNPAELAGGRKLQELKNSLRPKKKNRSTGYPDEPVMDQAAADRVDRYSEEELLEMLDGIDFPFDGAPSGEAGPEDYTDSRTMEEESYPEDRHLEDRIRYFIAAGAEQGLHVVVVVPQVRSLIQSGMLPDTGDIFASKLLMFRHQMAFHMSEDDSDECVLKVPSRKQLTESLSRCFLYRDGIHVVMREPYRLL